MHPLCKAFSQYLLYRYNFVTSLEMFVRPNHQLTQPCTNQTNGCQTHSMSAAKSLSVRLAQSSQISHPPSTRVFCHAAFPLGFLRCKQTKMFSICGCFSLIRVTRRDKERKRDKTRRKDQTTRAFALILNLLSCQVWMPGSIYAFLILQLQLSGSHCT